MFYSVFLAFTQIVSKQDNKSILAACSLVLVKGTGERPLVNMFDIFHQIGGTPVSIKAVFNRL